MSDAQLPQAPKIDTRTAADIVALLAGTVTGAEHKDGLLSVYTTSAPGSTTPYPFQPWQEVDPATGAPLGLSAALIRIFARFAEILIERLNRVPEKNLLAFLDLLGGERLPPQPAQVPLTFTLAAGSTVDAEVPAGTRVAAPPPPGAKDPIEFETEQAVTVSPARLDALLTLDPNNDRYGDWGVGEAAFPPFSGAKQIEHILYIGDSRLFAYPQIHAFSIVVEVAAEMTLSQALSWQYWNGEYLEDGQKKWVVIKPSEDDTEGLSKTGTIYFDALPILPRSDVNGFNSRWLRCILSEKISPDPSQELPRIKTLTTAVLLKREPEEGLMPDLSFINGAPLDVSKEFHPFGERPRLYDAFYLASEEAFASHPITSKASSDYFSPTVSSQVSLQISLANGHPAAADLQVRPSLDLELIWECWDGSLWTELGRSSAPDWLALVALDAAPILHSVDGKRVLILQGHAQNSVRISTSAHRPMASIEDLASMTEQRPMIDRFGRFADAWEIGQGVDIIALRAQSQAGLQQLWVVVPDDEQEVTVHFTAPKLETVLKEAGNQVTLLIQWNGGDMEIPEDYFVVCVEEQAQKSKERGQERVQALRITNGRLVDKTWTPTAWTVTRTRDARITVEVEVAEGRNDLLIEALAGSDDSSRRLAAVTAVIHRAAPPPRPNAKGFADGTYGLTQSGLVSLRLPESTSRTAVNGQEGHWIRVRILKGNYGREANYVLKDPTHPEEGFLLVPESFHPPIVREVRIGYELIHQRSPEVCLTYNQLTYIDHTKEANEGNETFLPFVGIDANQPALYLGLSLPAGRNNFSAKALSLYAQVDVPLYGKQTAGDSQSTSTGLAQVGWDYWNGNTWARLRVQDDTDNFTRSGLLTLLPPADFARSSLFGRDQWWLRARTGSGQKTPMPQLAWLRLNTTSALQVVSITNEILGSSNGTAGQSFHSARSPVLKNQHVEVREREEPGAQELASLREQEGFDVLRILPASSARAREVWVRWHEVPDLYGSDPSDRHYTINHLTGDIRFGNGVNGRIPTPGTSNLRLAHYRCGGGKAGNCAAGTVVQLKTTVPYIDKVFNPEPATGGADAENLEVMKARVPRQLRHLDRAVTPEDYEDLGLLASSEVARVRCVPLRDLEVSWSIEPDQFSSSFPSGHVSVIVVPSSEDPKPLPTQVLLERVRDHLAKSADATAKISVVGPRYVRVNVRTEVAVESPTAAAAVERALRTRLDAFLHPLTGGLEQRGWEFGRTPHRSDFFTIIEQVPGVDHCQHLDLEECEESQDVLSSGLFLIYSGDHVITLVFPEA
jgi:hypothetical protein